MLDVAGRYVVKVLPASGSPLGSGRFEKEQLANSPSQNLMKGYISREHSIVVLNKKGAFPGTGV